MPATSEKQRKAAAIELGKRRKDERKQQPRGKATRPFGAASTKTLREFARKQ